jgi:hypothetical protein
MKPSVISKAYPWSSIFQNSETEIVAQNTARILARTGDTFRDIGLDEYRAEREKDGNYSYREEALFEKVRPYFKSADTAATFCKDWTKLLSKVTA